MRWCVLAAACLSVAVQAAVADVGPATGPTTRTILEPVTIRLPSYGISARTPNGWMRGREDGLQTAMQWFRLTPDQKQAEGILRLVIQPVQGALKDMAQASASKTGMTVSAAPARLGVSPAVELVGTSPNPGGQMHLALARLCVRGRYAYILEYHVPNGQMPSRKPFDEVAGSVILSDPASPSTSVAMRNTVCPLGETGMVFCPPDPFRQSEQDPTRTLFKVYNFVTGGEEAGLTVATGSQRATTLEGMKQDTAKVDSEALGVKTPLVWTEVSTSPAVSYTNLVPATSPDGGHALIQTIVACTDEGRATMLILEFPGADAQVANRYAAKTADLAKTIRISKEYFEGLNAGKQEGAATNEGAASSAATGATAAPSSPAGGGLMEARKGFKTALIPGATGSGNVVEPPALPPVKQYQLVKYSSPVGPIPAYLSPNPLDGKKHPAVVWAHGGSAGLGSFWENEPAENDQTPRAFRDAGIVVMIPSWRGRGNNPGKYEMWYGEIDDTLAAIEYLRKVPYVDSSRIYMVGHSTGGTMTLLTAEASTKLRAAFSLGGCPDVQRLVTSEADHHGAPFDVANPQEGRLRSAVNFVGALTTPTWFFEGEEKAGASMYVEDAFRMQLAAQAAKAPFRAFALEGGTHFTIIRPVTRMLAEKILADTGATCGISIAQQDVVAAWGQVYPGKPMQCAMPPEKLPEIEVHPELVAHLRQSLRQQGVDPATGFIRIGKQGDKLTAESMYGPLPGRSVVIESNGYRVAVDYAAAATMQPIVVDFDLDRATRRVGIGIHAKGEKYERPVFLQQ